MTPAFHHYVFESRALRALVASAWGQAYGATSEPLPGLIAPDAHAEIVFQTGAPCAILGAAGGLTPPRAMVFALRHGAVRLQPTGANAMVALRLSPMVASLVLRCDLAACWDQPVALSDLIGAEADDLLDRIATARLAEVGPLLEAWLLSRLTDWGAEHARRLRLQSTLLWDTGDRPVYALADALGVTARTCAATAPPMPACRRSGW